MAYSIIATEPFEEEYDAVIDYLVNDLTSPQAAKSLVDAMGSMREALSVNPFIRAVSRKPALEEMELREYLVRSYLVVYRIEGKQVYLEHLYHQRQDFESLV